MRHVRSVGAWQLMEQKGTLISQPWGSFPRGQDGSVNLVVWKEALPHVTAGLGWAAAHGRWRLVSVRLSCSSLPTPFPGRLCDLRQVLIRVEGEILRQLTAEPSLA